MDSLCRSSVKDGAKCNSPQASNLGDACFISFSKEHTSKNTRKQESKKEGERGRETERKRNVKNTFKISKLKKDF